MRGSKSGSDDQMWFKTTSEHGPNQISVFTRMQHLCLCVCHTESESNVTYGQVWWPILRICALQLTYPKCTAHTHTHTHTHTQTHTHSSEHTHTRTHTQQWTHSSEHTHTQQGTHTHTHTHTEHWAAFMLRHRGAVEGSVPCSRTPHLWYWGWRECYTFTPPTYNPCRTEIQTHNLWIESDSLTIRPRLPTVPDVSEKILFVDSVITSYLDSTEHFRHKV